MTARLRRAQRSLDYSVDFLAQTLVGDRGAERDDDGAILFRGDFGETWDPPVHLVLTDQQFRRHLLSMAENASGAFPEVDPMEAAYRLFLVHLDEEMAMSATAGSRITIGRHGLDVDPVREPEPWPELDPNGDYEWVADRPDRSDGKLEFLSPEQYGARYRASVERATDPP